MGNYFLLLSIYRTTHLLFARDRALKILIHLYFFNSCLVLNDFLSQSLRLPRSWRLRAHLSLPTIVSLKGWIQITTSVQISSLQDYNILAVLVLFIQTAAVLFQRLWITENGVSVSTAVDVLVLVDDFVFLFLRKCLLIGIFAGWMSSGRGLCGLRVRDVRATCGLGWIFGALFLNYLVWKVNHFHTFATCACGRFLGLNATRIYNLGIHISHSLNRCYQFHLVNILNRCVAYCLIRRISIGGVATALLQNN